jgi:hypothetical protein
MMNEVLSRPGSMGSDGLKWWIGRVAPRSAWVNGGTLVNDKDVGVDSAKPEIDIYYNRVKVSVVGYHDKITNPVDLPWAHILATPMLPSGYGFKDATHYLEGGESVFGFWMDGEDQQKPVILGVFYRHKAAEDTTIPPKGSPAVSPPVGAAAEMENTGDLTSGITDPATGSEKQAQKPKSPITGTNNITGSPIEGAKPRPPVTDESSTEKGMSVAALQHHFNLNRKTNRPTCKRDNLIGAITGYLGDFAEILIGVEQYAGFYINTATGIATNLAGEIKLIAKLIAGILTGVLNKVRDTIFAFVGDKVSGFINSILPDEVKPIIGDATKTTLDLLYCLFEKFINSLLDIISSLLYSLVGQFINAATCAAEEFIGALLGQVNKFLDDTIGPVISSLNDVLGGVLSGISSFVGKALEVIGLVFNFIGCDKFKCPLPSRYDNSYGPTQQERDAVDKIASKASLLNIPLSYDENGEPDKTIGSALADAEKSPGSIFGLKEQTPKEKQNAAAVAAAAGPCNSGILVCGPPTITFFGGDGIGGLANAVINNSGTLIGAQILDGGFGYTQPPYVNIQDACGNGKGGKGTAVLGPNGTIIKVIIEFEGYGYYNDFKEVKTIYGDITDDSINDGSNSGEQEVIGFIDDIIIDGSGISYDEDDTIEIVPNEGAEIEPVIINGHIVGINIINPGQGFTSIPTVTINSETGIGAELTPVLGFKPIDQADPIDPGKIVTVIDCVSR